MKTFYGKLRYENVNEDAMKAGIRQEMFKLGKYVMIRMTEKGIDREVLCTWISKQDEKNNETHLVEEYLGGFPAGIEKVTKRFYEEKTGV